MTTIGVATYRHDNPKDVFVPSYSYRYPTGRRVQLTAVKEGIFHPRLPTIRQLDRDRTLHRLTDEHCRTSLPAEVLEPRSDFRRASTVDPATLRTRQKALEDSLDKDIRYQFVPEELRKAREDWSNFLNRCPERFRINLTEHPDTANTPYTGYAMRYLKPEVTSQWRFTLKQDPNFDKYGQSPIPATSLNKYRDVYSRSAANVSTAPYKPPYKNHWYHM